MAVGCSPMCVATDMEGMGGEGMGILGYEVEIQYLLVLELIPREETG